MSDCFKSANATFEKIAVVFDWVRYLMCYLCVIK